MSSSASITKPVTNRPRRSQLTVERFAEGSSDVYHTESDPKSFKDFWKWKVSGDTSHPPFPTPEEAAKLAPSVKIDLERLKRYTSVNDSAGTFKDQQQQGNKNAGAGGHTATAAADSSSSSATPPTQTIQDDGNKLLSTWMGHASFFVQVDGCNILTDPVFTERAAPVQFAGPKRFVPVPCKIKDLPRVDVVTISHNHYDHLQLPSVEELRKYHNPIFVVPMGMKTRWFSTLGWPKAELDHRVVELGWYQCTEIQIPSKRQESVSPTTSGSSSNNNDIPSFTSIVQVTCVPVQHWTMRSIFDRNKELWGGFVLEHFRSTDPALHSNKFFYDDNKTTSRENSSRSPKLVARWFHSGDTGYNPKFFKEIGKEFAHDASDVDHKISVVGGGANTSNNNDKDSENSTSCVNGNNNANTKKYEAKPNSESSKNNDDDDDDQQQKHQQEQETKSNEEESSSPPLFDLALLPIGAYHPRWFLSPQHVDPDQACIIFNELGKAKLAIGMHFATFILTDEPLDEPPKLLKEGCLKRGIPEGRFVAPKHGETFAVEMRGI